MAIFAVFGSLRRIFIDNHYDFDKLKHIKAIPRKNDNPWFYNSPE
jgi:hypothetical protein